MKPTLGTIYTEKLLKQIIIDPKLSIAKPELFILSGFASPSFSYQVLEDYCFDTSVNLVIGMGAQTGMLRSEHDAFIELQSKFSNRFKCKYYLGKPFIHSKIYVWQDGGNPLSGFAGSANFTWGGFRDNQEILIAADPNRLKPIYENALSKSISCADSKAPAKIKFLEKRDVVQENQAIHEVEKKKTFEEAKQHKMIKLSLLASHGETHNKGGLNWGHRGRKNIDEAYIPIPVSVDRGNPGFLPPQGDRFQLITDDNEYLWCKRGGTNGKNLSTPDDNSQMGRYFRKRMGMPSGKFILKEDLEKYGRTSISMSKIDGDTFFMDFSPKSK